MEIGLSPAERGLAILVLQPGNPFSLLEPAAFLDEQGYEPARDLRSNGSFSLSDHIAAGIEDGEGLGRIDTLKSTHLDSEIRGEEPPAVKDSDSCRDQEGENQRKGTLFPAPSYGHAFFVNVKFGEIVIRHRALASLTGY
jgi:hypothetical protein